MGAVSGCVATFSRHLWPRYLSVSLGSQLDIESRGSGGWGPVHFVLFEETQLVILMFLFLWSTTDDYMTQSCTKYMLYTYTFVEY